MLSSNCKRFLEGLGVCLDQRRGLNYAAKGFSVCDFSLEILEIALAASEFSRSCIMYGPIAYMFLNDNQSIS